MSKLSVVVGGAFGSEAKGAVTARLARESGVDGYRCTTVRVAGHNAGHTAYDDQGRPWALRTVPAAAVVPGVDLVIAAGSEVNPEVLISEVSALEAAGISVRNRLIVDPAATWLDDTHVATETNLSMHELSGSTGKGVGAARAARAMRTARTIGECDLIRDYCSVYDTGRMLRGRMASGGHHVIIEGTQGYGLGLHTRFYPLVTSSDTRAIDFLAMAGIDPTIAADYCVWVVMRRFPIRVAGPSGPLKGETTWEALGLPEELTTVTKKVRRVGMWDAQLAAEAVEANGGPTRVRVALTMADQEIPGIAGVTSWSELGPDGEQALKELIVDTERDCGASVHLVGTGPNSMIRIKL